MHPNFAQHDVLDGPSLNSVNAHIAIVIDDCLPKV